MVEGNTNRYEIIMIVKERTPTVLKVLAWHIQGLLYVQGDVIHILTVGLSTTGNKFKINSHSNQIVTGQTKIIGQKTTKISKPTMIIMHV